MYIITEIQSGADGVGIINQTAADRQHAESVYHMMLGAAAISAVKTHSVVLMTDEGFVLESKCYKHVPVPEPAPEPEPEPEQVQETTQEPVQEVTYSGEVESGE